MDIEFLRRTGRDAVILFLAAAVLGVVYNSASPLGVRWRSPAAGSAITSPGHATYSNETLAIAPQAQNHPSTNSRVQNETLAIAVQAGGSRAPAAFPAPKTIPAMTWPQVKAMGNAVVVVDAREPTAFDAGHVPNAVSLPTRLLPEKIAKFAADVPRNRPIVVYCANAQCPLSSTLAHALAEQYGYLDVRHVPGGYAEWLLTESPK
jgi:rhodanese-related sulfurtransferase